MVNHTCEASAPIHLQLLRGLVFAGTIVLFVGPLASGSGLGAALAAVPLGLWLGRQRLIARLRGPVLAGLVAGLVALGMLVSLLLGQPVWISQLLGPSVTMALIDAMIFGPTSLGMVLGLTWCRRFRWLAAIELSCVVGVVVYLFAGHRDSQIAQPRFLADWAFSRGIDPKLVLLIIGLATMSALVLLLLRQQRLRRTLAAIGLLLLFGLASLGLLQQSFPWHDLQSAAAATADDQLSFDGKSWPKRPRDTAIVTLHEEFPLTARNLYFIQSAYSQFNGNRLVRATAAGLDPDVPTAFPSRRVELPGGPAAADLYVEVPATISLLTEHSRPFALPSIRFLEPRPNADPKTFFCTYAASSRVLKVSYVQLAARQAGDPSWSEATRAHYLAHPSDPRYRQLGNRILAAGLNEAKLKPEYRGSPVIRALVIRRWLEQNTIYKFNPEHAGAVDPTASFLFGDRKGYCVHMAHAMTFLLRAQGIPARIAGGYMVESSRRGAGSSILLKATDAHSWCEIYLQDVGWVIMDASPERTEETPPPGVDPAAQQYFGERNRRPPPPPPEPEPEPHPGPSLTWLWQLPLVWLAALYAVKGWRRLAPRWASARQLYRVCYRAALDRLAEVGLNRQFGETREEFAHRLARWAPEFADLSAAHVRRAVGGLESVEPAQWLTLQRNVTARIAQVFPWYRRLLGLLNPLSLLWAC